MIGPGLALLVISTGLPLSVKAGRGCISGFSLDIRSADMGRRVGDEAMIPPKPYREVDLWRWIELRLWFLERRTTQLERRT